MDEGGIAYGVPELLQNQTRCTIDRKVLLVLNNHDSHILLHAAHFSGFNGIVVMIIPPHTSHRQQLLDKAVYGPFKTFYSRAMDSWVCNKPGVIASIKHISQLLILPICQPLL